MDRYYIVKVYNGCLPCPRYLYSVSYSMKESAMNAAYKSRNFAQVFETRKMEFSEWNYGKDYESILEEPTTKLIYQNEEAD